MLIKIRNFHFVKVLAVVLAVQMFMTAIGFNQAFAQGGGPTQPEVHSFEPIGTNQMVDLFTGDFTYNIPLFNIPGPDGGYPINLAYHSGIQMEQEASWAGLGWNINVGTINRQVRNLPDDFGGSEDDKITIKTDMKTNWTVGVGASFSPELVGLDLGELNQTPLSLSASIYYNNYRGVGYKLGVGINASFGKGGGIAGDLGFDLSLDSQEGINADVSIGASLTKEKTKSSLSAGTGFNTRTGWQQNLEIRGSITQSVDKIIAKKSKETKNERVVGGMRQSRSDFSSAGGGSTISFAESASGIGVPNQMRGGNGNISFGTGLNLFTFNGKFNVNAYFSFSKLKDKNKALAYNGIGYMYYQESLDSNNPVDDDKRVKDISRDNDGLVHKNTRRLASPTQTYDIYSVTGQGIGNMFRPYRYDIGTNQEPRKKSEYHGGNFGLEIPLSTPVNIRAGFDVGYNYSHNKVDFWPNPNAANLQFQKTSPSLSKSVYFQNYGEQTVDEHTANYGASVSSTKPVVYGLKNNSGFYDITSSDENNNGATINVNNTRTSRKRRAMGFEAFTNEMMLDTDGETAVIPEFDLSYYSSTSATGYNKATRSSYTYNARKARTKSHVGGYIATNTAGMRYVYGLAAYNNKDKDVSFSVEESTAMLTESKIPTPVSGGAVDYKAPGTNKYYQSKEKSPYAHSYMLTSVLGTDFVEFDDIAGPSDGDLGYWVKFDYAKAHSTLKWRAPFDGAMYNKGYEMSFKDGQGSYSVGDKEVWYLATVETKTHVAEFKVTPRKDAFAPDGELGQGMSATAGYYKLDRIDVYVKSERYPNGVYNANAKPIKSCHLVYDYSLCQGIPNNNGANDTGEEGTIINEGGKLTLKKVFFTYRNNATGSTAPYEFEYNTEVGNAPVTYDRDAVDRWGNYQPNVNASNVDYPYNNRETTKSQMDERAKIWSMSAINLPSGGRYEVDYESDSYAYVQDEVAMHMTKIVSLDDYGTNASGNDDIAHGKDATPVNRRVYFKLEQSIPGIYNSAERKPLMEKYIRPGEYMYFKVKINVTKVDDSKEYVAGYAKITKVDVDESSNVGGSFQWGYVELDFMKVDGKQTHFHPFTEVGARHIKYNHPDLLYDNPGNANADDLSKSDIKNAGYSLLSVGTDIMGIFKDYTAMLYGSGTKRLRKLDLSESSIRLRTTDKIKYGGGHRVKEVRVYDNWADAFIPGTSDETSSVYGTVYHYDMEEDGKMISSGVAAYEPMVGGDENPLRKPIEGWEDKSVLAKTLAQTYTEEPGNESLFPGASVGYRKVRVMSKNTAVKIANPSSAIESYAGITEHLFYTAKDYPVIRRVSELETDKTFRKSKLIIPAIIVNISRLRMAATQGYYIELNDMNGKPKGGREYGVNIQETSPGVFTVEEEDVSSVKYEYFDEEYTRTNDAGETIKNRRLVNEVDVLYSDMDPNDLTRSDISSGTLATEIEFIPETRYNESKQISGGLSFNFESFGFIPAFYPIPSFGHHTQKTGTVVTNKIVNKTAIMRRTIAIQGGSKVETENLVFDEFTGQPLLTTVTNNFGDKIYNYSILAQDQYEGTGPAYQNIGYEMNGSRLGVVADGVQHVALALNTSFFQGDQVIATPVYSNGSTDPSRDKVVLYYQKQVMSTGVLINDHLFETSQGLSTGDYRFTIIRSGRRNQLTMPISSMTTLSNPTINRDLSICNDVSRLGEQPITIKSINDVLSVNAIELGHHWNKDVRQLELTPSNWYDNSFYTKGMSGDYSVVRSYAYIDDRLQTENSGNTEVNLKGDGVLNGVKIFDWDNLLVSGTGCANNWMKTDQITLKNPSSFELELKNVTGTYTTQLFGKNGTEPIAIAGNSKNSEIGFENFEEYSEGVLAISENSTNNLNFYTTIDQTSRVVEDRFDVHSGEATSATVDEDISLLSLYSDWTMRMHVDGYLGGSDERITRENVVVGGIAGTNECAIGFLSTDDLNLTNIGWRKWRGELFGTKTIPNYPLSLSNPNVTIKEGKAHTGDKCLELNGIAGADFLQGRLTLRPGEKYQFSGWFSSPGNVFLLKNYNTLFNADFQLEFFDFNGVLVSTQTFKESDILNGSFIEDWQKFTIDFVMPVGAHYVSIKLPAANETYDNEIQDYSQIAYYDDLRMQPLDGGMQTYVYNQETQRLEAELDGNNYATFYYYDDEGALFLIKRETERGIITVEESRNYTRKN